MIKLYCTRPQGFRNLYDLVSFMENKRSLAGYSGCSFPNRELE